MCRFDSIVGVRKIVRRWVTAVLLISALPGWLLIGALPGWAEDGYSTKIFSSGDALSDNSPEQFSGFSYFWGFEGWSLTDNSQVLFPADFYHSVTGSTGRGIFTYTNGAITELVRTGDAAPGGGGGQFVYMWDPQINESGDMAFYSYAETPSLDYEAGVFLHSNDTTRSIVRTDVSTPAPGSNPGAPLLNNAGQVALKISIDADMDGTDDIGIYVDSGGGLARLVGVGETAPGGNGGTFGTFDTFIYNGYAPSMFLIDFNDNGQVLFSSKVTVPDPTNPGESISETGLFAAGGGVTAIVRSGDSATGGDGGMFTGGTVNEQFNNAGQAAFIAGLTTDAYGVPSNQTGLFLGSGGTPTALMRRGDSAPGGNGGEFLEPTTLALNNSGQVAFWGTIDTDQDGYLDERGLFLSSGATLKSLARIQAPVTGVSGGQFAVGLGGIIDEDEEPDADVLLNDGGVAVFIADVDTDADGNLDGFADQTRLFLADDEEQVSIELSSYLQLMDLNERGQVTYWDGREPFLFTPDLHWRRATSGGWDDDSHDKWTLGIKPDVPHRVFIDPDNGLTVTGPGADTTIRSLTIGTKGIDTTAQLDITSLAGGNLTITDDLIVGGDGNGTMDHSAKKVTVEGDIWVGQASGDKGTYTLGGYATLEVGGIMHVGNTDPAAGSPAPDGRFENNKKIVLALNVDSCLIAHGSNARIIGPGTYDIKVTYESNPVYGANSDQSVDVTFDRKSLTQGAAHTITQGLTDGEAGSTEKATTLQTRLLANSSFDINWWGVALDPEDPEYPGDPEDIAYNPSTKYKPEIAVPYNPAEVQGNNKLDEQDVEKRMRLWHFRDGKVSNITDVDADSTPRVDTAEQVVFGRAQDDVQLLDEFNVAVGGIAVDPVHQDPNIRALHELGLSGNGVKMGQIEPRVPYKEHGPFMDWDDPDASALRITVEDTAVEGDDVSAHATRVASLMIGYDPLAIQVDVDSQFRDADKRVGGGFGFTGVAPEAELSSRATGTVPKESPAKFKDALTAFIGETDIPEVINMSAQLSVIPTPDGTSEEERALDYHVADGRIPENQSVMVDGRMVNVVREHGIIFTKSAGNKGQLSGKPLTVPAGAYNALVVGAVQMGAKDPGNNPIDFPTDFTAAQAEVASFSSHGPTPDPGPGIGQEPRVGIDLVAQGVANLTAFQAKDINGTDNLENASPRRGLYSTQNSDQGDAEFNKVVVGTSFAAPTVAGVAALLLEKAKMENSETAESPLVIKSVLQTSADKLGGWKKGDPDTTSDDDFVPLDYAQGAGLMDPIGAYNLLTAGEFEDGPDPVGNLGWDWDVIFEDNVSGFDGLGGNVYFLDDVAGTLTATLNWYRHVGDDFTAKTLTNLDLLLYGWDETIGMATLIDESISPGDNLEHIYLKGLAAGDYLLQVFGATFLDVGSVDYEEYALSWEFSTVPEPGAIWLFGSGLLGLLLARRRRKT